MRTCLRRLRPSRSPERSGERGFVLIAAIWLLILAGSITAVLMLRSLAGSAAASGHQEALARRLALESAIETMLADRLFNGGRSPWWLVPAEGTIAVDGRQVTLRVTSESGRLDVNAADPKLLDGTLRGFDLAPAERERILDRLLALRATKKRIGSLAELTGLVGNAGGSVCLPDQLTYLSGLATPRPDQMSPELAHAIGAAISNAGARSDVEGGAALRVEARDADGAAMIAIIRSSGLPDRPLLVSAWGDSPPCP